MRTKIVRRAAAGQRPQRSGGPGWDVRPTACPDAPAWVGVSHGRSTPATPAGVLAQLFGDGFILEDQFATRAKAAEYVEGLACLRSCEHPSTPVFQALSDRNEQILRWKLTTA